MIAITSKRKLQYSLKKLGDEHKMFVPLNRLTYSRLGSSKIKKNYLVINTESPWFKKLRFPLSLCVFYGL